MELCDRLEIRFREREFQVYDVMNADEAFTASTPNCLMPVTRINGAPIGDGTPGPIYRRLILAWSELVGLDIEAQILSPDGDPNG
jgi:branched-chain amino acid aminotransferase